MESELYRLIEAKLICWNDIIDSTQIPLNYSETQEFKTETETEIPTTLNEKLLVTAAYNGNTDLVANLLENACLRLNNSRFMPLRMSAIQGSIVLFKLILEYSSKFIPVNYSSETVSSVDSLAPIKNGKEELFRFYPLVYSECLHKALTNSNNEVYRYLLEDSEIARVVCDNFKLKVLQGVIHNSNFSKFKVTLETFRYITDAIVFIVESRTIGKF